MKNESPAQNRSDEAAAARLANATRLGRVFLRVADAERALGFYCGLLGLRVVRADGDTVALAAHADGSAAPRELVVLREVPGLRKRPRRPQTTGLYHVAFLLPSRRALGRALLGLRAAGYPLRGLSDHAVSESIYLDDPDGNGLELYADRPRSAWPMDGSCVRLTTEPMDTAGVLAAAGMPDAPWAGLPPATTIGHVHLTVADLERSVAFYRDAVGFGVTLRVPTLVGVAAGGYHHHLNLNTWAGTGAPPDGERTAGLDRWELVVPAAAQEALARRLRAHDQQRGPTEHGVLRARDPDGISFDVLAER